NRELATYIGADAPRDNLWAHIENFIRNSQFTKGKLSDPVLEIINEGVKHGTSLELFFQKIAVDRADAPNWSELNDDSKRAEWLLHQLFRKNASPGRVHRFWRTAREFVSEALKELRSLVSKPCGNRTRRLKLELSHLGSASNCRDKGEV